MTWKENEGFWMILLYKVFSLHKCWGTTKDVYTYFPSGLFCSLLITMLLFVNRQYSCLLLCYCL